MTRLAFDSPAGQGGHGVVLGKGCFANVAAARSPSACFAILTMTAGYYAALRQCLPGRDAAEEPPSGAFGAAGAEAKGRDCFPKPRFAGQVDASRSSPRFASLLVRLCPGDGKKRDCHVAAPRLLAMTGWSGWACSRLYNVSAQPACPIGWPDSYLRWRKDTSGGSRYLSR